ncbi:MAG: AsnC family protein [Nitrososphaerales archaeon]
MVNEPTGKNSGTAIPEMAQLAKLIMKMGPDIDLIARISGQYKETIRYRYKEKIIGKGFAIHARVNYEGLGLQRVIMKVSLNETYARYAREMFLAMNKLCYVISFNQLLPDSGYMVHASVPREHKEGFIDLMKHLKDQGIFETLEFYSFDWFTNTPMRAEFFDFEHGNWDFDWTRTVEPGKDDEIRISEPFKFDKLDLLILKELQLDASRSLSEIRESIKANNGQDINYKTLAWHWSRHVQEKGMINGYALRWMGTSYDSVSDRAKHRQHKYIMIPVFVRGVSDAERISLIGAMNKLPFLWCEAGGKDYHAQLAFPVETVNDAFSFLKDVLAPFGSRATYSVLDQTNALSFTFSYTLFDEETKSWAFNGPELKSRFENLVIKIRESSGLPRN